MKPVWMFGIVLSGLIALADAQVGVAGLLVFFVLYAISGGVDSRVESVNSTSAALSTGCLILAIGFVAIVFLFVLGGGGEMVSR